MDNLISSYNLASGSRSNVPVRNIDGKVVLGNINRLCAENEVNLYDLLRLLNIPESYINDLESGIVRGAKSMQKITNYFKLDPYYLTVDHNKDK